MTRFHVTAITHRGRIRPRNEDTVAVGRWICNGSMDEPRVFAPSSARPFVCLVADGIGGHAAGDVASRRAAEFLAEAAPDSADAAALADALRRLNRVLFEATARDRALAGMGTTVAGLVLRQDGILWFNVGDSRVYRLRDGSLTQVSVDDSPPASADGSMTSHILTQALGGAATPVEIDPHAGAEPVMVGAKYLVCSDGLSDMLPPEWIEDAVAESDLETARNLLERTMAAGARDNVSIVLASIGGDDTESPPPDLRRGRG